jgi:hypothetical protein
MKILLLTFTSLFYSFHQQSHYKNQEDLRIFAFISGIFFGVKGGEHIRLKTSSPSLEDLGSHNVSQP